MDTDYKSYYEYIYPTVVSNFNTKRSNYSDMFKSKKDNIRKVEPVTEAYKGKYIDVRV